MSLASAPVVVTAFYQMDSKFPCNKYIQWIHNFLTNIKADTVFFTDAPLIPIFQKMRDSDIKYVPLPREQWTAYTKYGRQFWESQRSIDREAAIHSADLYAIWYEKKEFVRRAQELYPDRDKFIWCDAGAFRNEMVARDLSTFGGSPYRIPEGKMVLLQVFPFTSEERTEHSGDGIGNFKCVDRIGGGIQAGDRSAWAKWTTAYDDKLAQMNDAGLFVGKDQTIMAAVVLSNPEIVHIIHARNDIYDRWFTLLYHLSGPKVSILIPVYNGSEYLLSAVDSVIKQTYKQWEIIIGVNGHPAGSEIHALAVKIASQEDRLERIRVIDMPDIRGKSAALNRMTQLADPCAEWIALLDVDDLWHPEKLNRQFGAIEHSQPQPDVIGTHCKYFGELHGSPNIPTGDISQFDFWSVNPVLNSSCIIRRHLAYWNTENTYGLEDYELWLRLRYSGSRRTVFYNLPSHLMYHRIHKSSEFNSGENADRLPDFLVRMKAELRQ